ncbi:MAG TPA: ECF-type sigma factor [Thermoanaerobaculia bacterium]|nr:ECF-type sigma factor [Thermoanaerobaculia bacterium]
MHSIAIRPGARTRCTLSSRRGPGRPAAAAPIRDALAWDRIVPRYQRRLAKIVQRALVRARGHARPDEVEELVQETWCRVFERGRRRLGRIHTVDGGEGSFAYVARIARNVTVDRLRNERAAKRGWGWLRADEEAGGEHPAAAVDDGLPSPEDRAIHRDLLRRFRDHCRQCLGPRGTRGELMALELALLEGLPSRRIAELVGGGLDAHAVDRLVHRTRRALGRQGIRFGARR